MVTGGSGKTPTVAAVVRLLQAHGERPAILSRGYKRQVTVGGVVVVGDGTDVLEPVERSGDEPQMLARALPGVPVLVSPDRYLAGQVAEQRFGVSVHVLDDGFQHLQLGRDVDLVIVSPSDLDEQVLPVGRLREPIGAACSADALLVPGDPPDARALADRLGLKTWFRLVPHFDALRAVSPFGVGFVPTPSRRAVAVAGIARPSRFFAALEAEGWEVVRTCVFGDHHWFTPRDLEHIRRVAADAGVETVITTEKDAVRLNQPGTHWAFLPMRVSIEPADQCAAWLVDRVRAAREEQGASA